MYYAPIYIPTLCRYEHLKRGLESLKKNSWARYTDVYIALDYPAKESHWEGYRKICEYLENEDFSIFSRFVVVKREKNYGAGMNSRIMCNEIMRKYDRWIFAEDDVVFAHNFLEYMDKCLEYFENDDEVLAVNGYTYPIDWKLEKDSTVFKQSATFSAWGAGYWKKKYLAVRQELASGYLRENFDRAVHDGTLSKMIKGRYCDYVIFALSGEHEGLYYKTSDVALSIYLKLKRMVVISPAITKTRNYGFDGSGLYCSKIEMITDNNSMEYDYTQQPMDKSKEIEIIMDEGLDYDAGEKSLGDFLYVDVSTQKKVKILMMIYRIFGLKRCGKIYQKIKKLFKRKNKCD